MLGGMKRPASTIGFASILLIGCTSNTASILDPTIKNPSGFTGIETMNACVTENGECYLLEVESDGTSIARIHYPIDIWVDTTESGCSNGYCWATDANGAEWLMEP